MDSWPTCNVEQRAGTSEDKGKGKHKDRGEWSYPVIEDGSLGAATLRRNRKGLEWTFLAGDIRERKLVATHGPIEVFPSTRSGSIRASHTTALRRAEQGAHFIRTYYPDVDIPAELLREEIANDIQSSQRRDAPLGGMLDVCTISAARKPLTYLAFPMGETNRDLNLSALVWSKGTTQLEASASAVKTFDTPICQILASTQPSDWSRTRTASVLGVRTMGSTHFLQVKLPATRSGTAVEVSPIVSVHRGDLGDRHAVDVAISPTNPIELCHVLTDEGKVYCCTAPNGRKIITLVYQPPDVVRPYQCIASDPFDDSGRQILAVSPTCVSIVDVRAGTALDLYAASQPEVLLTSVQPYDSRTILAASTRELLWLDNRRPGRPLLAIKHDRDHDTTLRACTHILSKRPLTFLTSRRNGMVTVYDVSRDNGGPFQMHSQPYTFPVISPDGPHLGQTFLPQTSTTGDGYITMIQMAERGSIKLVDMEQYPYSQLNNAPRPTSRHVDWTPEILKLQKGPNPIQAGLGHLSGRQYSEVDMEPAYHRLFSDRHETDAAVQTEAVYDTLEQMPLFWRESGAGVEHAVTTFDIALWSGLEPNEASRSDWFTGSTLDCAAGYRALAQGRIDPQILAKASPRHVEVTSFVRCQVSELQENLSSTIECLSSYDLKDGPERTAASFRRESEARSQLALDLSLASDVYYPQQLTTKGTPSFEDDLLNISRSTEAMSLGKTRIPPVQFYFLRPTFVGGRREDGAKQSQSSGDDVDRTTSEKIGTLSPGVRLLLSGWEIGSDPEQHVYTDPYGGEDTTPSIVPLRPQDARSQRPNAVTHVVGPQTSQPPVVAPAIVTGPPIIAASQPIQARKAPALAAARSLDVLPQTQQAPSGGTQPSQSQDGWGAPHNPRDAMISSTQVLPGPHGGRVPAPKKKTVKKRMGGF